MNGVQKKLVHLRLAHMRLIDHDAHHLGFAVPEGQPVPRGTHNAPVLVVTRGTWEQPRQTAEGAPVAAECHIAWNHIAARLPWDSWRVRVRRIHGAE